MEDQNDRAQVLSLLHASNPYLGFDAHHYPIDLQGWNGESPIFDQLICEIRPRRIIEVGSWKGLSTVTMGQSIKRYGLQASIICVDTWLGSLEFWTDQTDATTYRALRHRWGYPTVYYQFLANIVHSGLQDVVVPFPQTSAIAARWFARHRIRADLIYIDGSHDELDVRADLENYWPLVEEGGCLFGDDFNLPSVRRAVNSLWSGRVKSRAGFWLLRRPK